MYNREPAKRKRNTSWRSRWRARKSEIKASSRVVASLVSTRIWSGGSLTMSGSWRGIANSREALAGATGQDSEGMFTFVCIFLFTLLLFDALFDGIGGLSN